MGLDVQSNLERQEIHCSDCKHNYSVTRGLKSARCPECGNIEYLLLSPAKAPPRRMPLPTQVAVFIEALKESGTGLPSLAKTDPLVVETILRRYFSEWHLWSALTTHFDDPNFHVAYLSFCARRLELAKAGERYLKHQRVFAPLDHEAWQASLSEQMLERVKTLADLQWERFTQNATQPMYDLGPYKRRGAWTLAWIFLGTVLVLSVVGTSLFR